MPHDAKGTRVIEGQLVSVLFKVTSVSTNEEACNCTLETVTPMFPYEHKTCLVVNTRQVEVVTDAG